MFQNIQGQIKRERSALVVWDVQEALVSAIFNRDEFLSNLARIIQRSRHLNLPLFYSKITPLPEKFESPLRRASGFGKFEPGDIVKEVYPEKSDVVINKNTASFFIGTNFELMIRNAGINVIYFTGIATEMGVETSARHAQNLGFIPIIIQDAVSSRDRDAHERSLKNLSRMMPVISTEEFLKTV
ncbi:MAG: cysteine hydrolase [Thermoplasmatales archaeon]|jgi:nicotinamidase-related amidase|nr:cysteine hydrolase [Candidatus Thermoplasmatota archaeon]MCL6003457.1 cysteine hydrolase [Candidatus Thermoplasmatota archaeon]MDA8055760.1 cysteine hydrolase [Thermoplasmatales archaeon]